MKEFNAFVDKFILDTGIELGLACLLFLILNDIARYTMHRLYTQ